MSVTGEPDHDPVLIGVPISDFTGSLLLVQGVLLALESKRRTGLGQKVDVSMLAGTISALSTRLATYWATGLDPKPAGSSHNVVVPYQAFHTKDGYVVAGVWGAGKSWPQFCEAIEQPQLVNDERFATNEHRMANRLDLIRLLEPIFCQRTSSQWEERFRHAGALFGRVNSVSEALSQPQVQHDGLVVEVDHVALGPIPQLAPPIRFSQSSAGVRAAPPVLGQHTREVLEEAGYTRHEIDGFLEREVAAVYEMGEVSQHV